MTASVKPPAALKRRKLSLKQWQQPKTLLGQRGEARALNYLISKHYKILDTNVLFSVGEIDIVALDPSTNNIVFCEVKTRTMRSDIHPAVAFNWKKSLSLRKAINRFLSLYPPENDFRIDVIAVSPSGIEHFENVSMD